jgi:hypothetical protein
LCHISYFLKILRLSGFRLVGVVVYCPQGKNRLERIKNELNWIADEVACLGQHFLDVVADESVKA